MNSFTLALRYLRHRWLLASLNVLILASGIALMAALLLVNAEGEDALGKNHRSGYRRQGQSDADHTFQRVSCGCANGKYSARRSGKIAKTSAGEKSYSAGAGR